MTHKERNTTGGVMGLATKGITAVAVVATLALVPAAAQANIEAGHPEVYENGNLIAEEQGKAVPLEVWGQVHSTSVELGSEGSECSSSAMVSLWNESPQATRRGMGKVLEWSAASHVPVGSHPELSASCRPLSEAGRPKSFWTDEGYVRSEENESHEVEVALRRNSTPWNLELSCGVREFGTEYTTIARIGVPSSEFPKPAKPCPGTEPTLEEEQNEVASYKKEREEKKGCYASVPAPEGCIRQTIVEPGTGLEEAYGGTLRLEWLNGSKNGLSASRWKYEGANSGELQCEFPSGCAATDTWTGELKAVGYKIQLITAR
jgi:hypothetical protein